ncbi:MAG: trehalose 6-phosphate synthase [Candidatus Cloacimonadota bacterium]|nr:trehalose 6-phosphate synthase [Candidatus Cloacimonadota bacterium]
MKVNNIQEFYDLMFKTRDIKREILKKYIQGKPISKSKIDSLKETTEILQQIPQENSKFVLKYAENKKVFINLDYEIGELEKDFYFLNSNMEDFLKYLEKLNHNFKQDIQKGKHFLANKNIDNFISDRDGTVNNYCGRYNSSIQSIYNAYFLISLAKLIKKPIILTSAPLENIGFLDINIMPENFYIIAGSKGREFTWNNQRYNMKIDSKMQQFLRKLNERLQSLVKEPQYEIFALIGSGLQFKFGQTTIARQDIYNSIPKQNSQAFLTKVTEIVREIDPDMKIFTIEDTGKDIEIILNKQDGKSFSEFDKGDGVKFISQQMKINLENSQNLICGDTSSDIAMVDYASKMHNYNYTIFVTQNRELKKNIEKINSKNLFVSSPDALVTILYEYSKKGVNRK